jgi:hypothetical protein
VSNAPLPLPFPFFSSHLHRALLIMALLIC